MNTMKKILAMLLALTMVLSLCAFAEEEADVDVTEVTDDTVVGTVIGHDVTKGDMDDLIDYYTYYGYSADYTMAKEYYEFCYALEAIIDEQGLNQFTEEEEAAFMAEAEEEWNTALESYVSYYLTEDTEEERAELMAAADQYYTGLGYSVEILCDYLKEDVAYERLDAYLLPDGATDEEVEAYYAELVTESQQTIAMYALYMGSEAATYEYLSQYGTYFGVDTLYYIPEGFRNVLHILIATDEELLNAYNDAVDAYDTLSSDYEAQQMGDVEEETVEETEEAEEAEEEEVVVITAEQVEEARIAMEEAKAAVFASVQSTVDEIEARLANGEEFKVVAADYNQDAGQDYETGYDVSRDSILWVSAFVEGAFDEKMQEPGDHSNPVLSEYGVHILYYVKDVPAGGVELTDELRAEIKSELDSDKLSEAQVAAANARIEQGPVTWDEDLIAQLNAELSAEEEADE